MKYLISQPVALIWIALYNWRRYPLFFSLGILCMLVNKIIYYYFANTWHYWIYSSYIGHALLLIVITALVYHHRVSLLPVLIGFGALVAVYLVPHLFDMPFRISWALRGELARVGLYCSLFALRKVPAAEIGTFIDSPLQKVYQWLRRVIAEPAHILFVYGCASSVSDIIKVSIGGKIELYLLRTLNPNLFEAMLIAWIIGMYIRRDGGYANEID